MFRRDLRGSDTWCGLHNIVLLVMAGVMLMTAEVSAARVSNSFVTIEGDGVYVCDDGRIGFSAGPERSVTATARSGWRVNGRDSVSFKTSPGVFMTLKMTSAFGEDGETVDCEEDEDPEDDGNPADDEDPEDDDGEEEDDPEDDDECDWEAYYETNHVSGTSCAVKVTVDPERQAVMYALPAKGTNVSVSADYEVVARAKHEVYRRWRCAKHQNCDKTHDPEEEFVESFDVEPDTFAWTATGTNGTVRSSAWSGFLSKGLDQKVAFELKASKSGCGAPGCRCEASEKAYVDVYELSVERPDYLGLDLTDAMKGRDVTRTATAKIDPAPASATYKWTSCGRCKFIGGKDAASVTYGGNDKTGGSESYLAEPLSVTATAKNAAGQSASASCTTNFTVVAVNVSVGGAGEDGEEENAKEVCYCKDNDDGSLKDFAKENLVPVRITCQPKDLPGIVELTPKSEYAQLFVKDANGSLANAGPAYFCKDIGRQDFVLHGHSLPDGWMDKVFDAVKSFFVKDSLTVTHSDSGAIDKGVFKVVPPPPLEITDVQFLSPSKENNGAWPYDPVWDDDDWKATIDGILAKECAEDVDDATVKYTLSRDAQMVDIEFWISDPYEDNNVRILSDSPSSGGIHEELWAMPNNLNPANYYARVVAIEAETDKERTAKSNKGELKRECYYRSTATNGMVGLLYSVTEEEHEALVIAVAASGGALAFAGVVSVPEIVKWLLMAAGLAQSIGPDGLPSWYSPNTEIYYVEWTVYRLQWMDGEYFEPSLTERTLDVWKVGRVQVWKPSGNRKYRKAVEEYYTKEYQPTIGFDEWIWSEKPTAGYGLSFPEVWENSGLDLVN